METRREELFSTNVAAGSRTYFFGVKESVNGDKYLTVSESRKDIVRADSNTAGSWYTRSTLSNLLME